MFLFWNRISWVTCYDRDSFFVSGALTFARLSSDRESSSWSRISNIILTFCRCCLIIPLHICLLLRIVVYFSLLKKYMQKISANIRKSINGQSQSVNGDGNPEGNNKNGKGNILMRTLKSKAFHKGLFIAMIMLIIKYIILNYIITPDMIDISKIIFGISIISAFTNSLFEELFGHMYINGKFNPSYPFIGKEGNINTNTLFSEGTSEYSKAEGKMKEDNIGDEADLGKRKRKREIDNEDDELLERGLKQSKKEQSIVDSSLEGESSKMVETSTAEQSFTNQETSKITETFTSTETSAMPDTVLSSQDENPPAEQTPDPDDPLMEDAWNFRHGEAIRRQRDIIVAEQKFEEYNAKWPDHHNIRGAASREFEDDVDMIKEEYNKALSMFDEQSRYINQLVEAHKRIPADVRDPRVDHFSIPDLPESHTDAETTEETSANDSGIEED